MPTNSEQQLHDPEWDDSPVALNIIGKLIEEHPEWRMVSHLGPDGNEYMMLQFPHSGEFNGEADGEFVSLVSNLEVDDGGE